MGTAARKARKRSGIPYVKPRKRPTGRYGDPLSIGLISGPEIMARILARRTR